MKGMKQGKYLKKENRQTGTMVISLDRGSNKPDPGQSKRLYQGLA